MPQRDGSCRWGAEPECWNPMERLDAAAGQLVHYEVDPCQNRLMMLVDSTQVPEVDQNDESAVMLTTAMQCVLVELQSTSTAHWQASCHTVAQQGHEWRAIGLVEMGLFLDDVLPEQTREIMSVLVQPGWCLDISDTGCQLQGDPATCDSIRSDPTAYRSAVAAGVAAALLGLGCGPSQMLPLHKALIRLQNEAVSTPQLPETPQPHEIARAVLSLLTWANAERQIEIATKLAVYTREASAELCGPVALSVACQSGQPDSLMVIRRHAVSLLLDVSSISCSPSPMDSEPSRHLQLLLGKMGELEGFKINQPPMLHDIHQLLLKQMSLEARLELVHLIDQFPVAPQAADGFASFLDSIKQLTAGLSRMPASEPSPASRQWVAPDTLVIRLARSLLYERLELVKRLAMLLTFVVLPNVHSDELSYLGCIPHCAGYAGRAKQLLVEVMRLFKALFVANWLALQPLLGRTHLEPERSMAILSESAAHARGQSGSMCEQSVMALYLDVHREELSTASELQGVPAVALAAVSLTAIMTVSCLERHGQRDETVKLCQFLHQHSEHRTLEALFKHLGDQADTPALMYLRGCSCLQMGENEKASVHHDQRNDSAMETVVLEKTEGSEVLGLMLHGSSDGLIIVGMEEDSVAGQSDQLRIGDIIMLVNGINVATMSTNQLTTLLQTSKVLELRVHSSARATGAQHLFSQASEYFLAAAPVAVPTSELLRELWCARAVSSQSPTWESMYSYFMNAGRGVIELVQRSKAWDGVIELSYAALSAIEQCSSMQGMDTDEMDADDGESSAISVQDARDQMLQMLFRASLEKLRESPPRSQAVLDQVVASLHRLPASHRKTAVRQLVKALVPIRSCVRDIEALCLVPLIGLEVEVESVLWEEARHHDLSYYDVLHAYLSSRNMYRSVAAAALEKAQRLTQSNNKNSLEALEQQASSYAAAANALQLVKPVSHSSSLSGAENGGRYILCDYREMPVVNKRKRNGMIACAASHCLIAVLVPGEESEAEVSSDANLEHKARVVMASKQVEQWCAVTRAYVALARKSVHASAERHAAVLPPPCSEVQEIVNKLLQCALYEPAAELCAIYDMSLIPIFEQLASDCIQSHMRGARSIMEQAPKRVASAVNTARASLVRDTDEWKLLCRLLIEHDQQHESINGRSPSFELHKAVLDQILCEDSRLGFPVILLHSFRSCIECSLGLEIEHSLPEDDSLAVGVHVNFFEKSGLLGMSLLTTVIMLAVKHHTPSLLHEAAILVQDALRAHQNATTHQRNNPSELHPMAKVWFPFDHLDRLMTLLLYHGIPRDPSVDKIGEDICPHATLNQDAESIRSLLSDSSILVAF